MIPHETIPIFGMSWWQSNVITILIIFLVLFLGKQSDRTQIKKIAYILGSIMISRAIFIHAYLIYLGKWNIQSSLPLQMCSISAILAGVVIFWRNQWLYEFLFFWGIPGAFHSLLTPEFTNGTEGFLFVEYFISHGGIILNALFITLYLDMKPRKGSWWKIAIWSQIPVGIIAIINWLIDANYMYLREKPIVNNPFIIGEWPWYILILEGVGLLHFFIIYLPFGLKYKKIKG